MINVVEILLQQKTGELPSRANKVAGTSTLQIINSIPKFDCTDYVEWSRSFNDIVQISWPFLSKIISGLEKPKPILRSREEDPNEGSDNNTGCIDKREHSNVDDINGAPHTWAEKIYFGHKILMRPSHDCSY